MRQRGFHFWTRLQCCYALLLCLIEYVFAALQRLAWRHTKGATNRLLKKKSENFSNTLPIALEGWNTKYVQFTVNVKRCLNHQVYIGTISTFSWCLFFYMHLLDFMLDNVSVMHYVTCTVHFRHHSLSSFRKLLGVMKDIGLWKIKLQNFTFIPLFQFICCLAFSVHF